MGLEVPGRLLAGLSSVGSVLLAGCGPAPGAGPRAPEAAVLGMLELADVDEARRAELIAVGRDTFATMECGQCHRFDSKPATGPSLKGISGSTVRVHDPTAASGVRELTADRSWLWESIVLSQASFVHGYEQSTRMSRYEQVLDSDEVAGLIAWLETR